MINDEELMQLSAYIDQELNEQDRLLFEQRLEQEPKLRKLLNEMRTNDQTIQDLFNPVADEPLPDSLVDLINNDVAEPEDPETKVVPIHSAKKAQIFWGPALAASLLLGVAIILWPGKNAEQSIELANNQVITAGSALAQLFDNKLSGESAMIGESNITLELSFLRQDDVFCRQYLEQHGDYNVHSIACKEGGTWKNVVTKPLESEVIKHNNYRLAESKSSETTGRYIVENINGIPLTPAQEETLLLGF